MKEDLLKMLMSDEESVVSLGLVACCGLSFKQFVSLCEKVLKKKVEQKYAAKAKNDPDIFDINVMGVGFHIFVIQKIGGGYDRFVAIGLTGDEKPWQRFGVPQPIGTRSRAILWKELHKTIK